ncbi:hypothetical protein D3C81_1727740 [compost metagenome]
MLFAVQCTRRSQGRQRLLIECQRNFQSEYRTATFLALRAQGAAHAFGQRAGDRQTETGAAIAP